MSARVHKYWETTSLRPTVRGDTALSGKLLETQWPASRMRSTRRANRSVVIAMNSVVVFGGSGFLGRAIVDQLVAAGMTARVAVRHPDAMKVPDATAAGGHVLSVHADVADEKSVGRAVEGCDVAVNAVGLYIEGRDTALYSGMRLGEIIQMQVSDVRCLDGIDSRLTPATTKRTRTR